jgi:hypothetical protein
MVPGRYPKVIIIIIIIIIVIIELPLMRIFVPSLVLYLLNTNKLPAAQLNEIDDDNV